MKESSEKLSNKGFFKALFVGFVVLIGSGLLLVVGSVFHEHAVLEKDDSIQPLVFHGTDFQITLGSGSVIDKKLVLKRLREGNAVVTKSNSMLEADRFSVLEYCLHGVHPDLKVAFYWARKEDPRKTHFAILPWKGEGCLSYRLANHEEWKGKIVEFGLSINGALRDQPVVIEKLVLESLDPTTLLSIVWSEWSTFERWKQSSINSILGAPKSALLSPVVAAAVWSGLAIVLFGGWYALNRPDYSGQYFMVIVASLFLIPWLVLDAKWQWNLLRQHKETWYLFAGKSHHEQHMSAEDAPIYRFAQKVQEHLKGYPAGRMFILSQRWRDYVRLKMMYYLLPMNIYNYGSLPNLKLIEKGDYILALSSLKWMKYDAGNSVLRWGEDRSLRVGLLYRGSMGSLYQVVE